METSSVLAYLENLVERIERDAGTGKLKLEGVISEKEYRALLTALESFDHTPEPAEPADEPPKKPEEAVVAPPKHEAVPLNLDSIALAFPENPSVLLCLDFGTATSKAFATDETDENYIDLPIGKQAGQTASIYSLVSSIFITDSGRIIFGSKAVSESTHADAGGRRRFDSVKDILCKDVVCDLDEAPLERAYNPTDVPLTKGDMVTLFLGFFTDMATSALEQHNISRYVRRRFTLPVLPHDRAPWAEDQLRSLLARAQILADTLHGQWHQGIDVETAKDVLKQIRNMEELPTFLIDEGVMEPVAAVGSRFRNFVCSKESRRLLMVVDVGAGTIDFALFAEIHKKGKPLRVMQIPNSIQVLRQAGDAVDKLLRRFILKQANVETTDSDFHMIDADLSLRIRQLKERLFRDKRVDFNLTNDAAGEVTLDKFLSHPGVDELSKAIQGKFSQCLEGTDRSWIDGLYTSGLAVVFTGGGASLPMIRSLGQGTAFAHGRQMSIQASIPVPAWVEKDAPELSDEFPQLAVAIGGASRSLPVLAPSTFEMFGGLDAEGWNIAPAYKGS